MYDISVAKGAELIRYGRELIADPSAFETKTKLQGHRFVNCVPPIGFAAWVLTGRLMCEMDCWQSIIGISEHLRIPCLLSI